MKQVIMKQEKSKSVSISDAITALKEGDDNALFQFMAIVENAAKDGNLKKARLVRDKVLYQLGQNQKLADTELAQEVMAVLNDAIGQARTHVKSAFKSKKPSRTRAPKTVSKKQLSEKQREAAAREELKRREAMPGVFREVTVVSPQKGTQARVELFFGYSKKGKEIIRVYAVKSGDTHILTPGSTYQLFGLNMPQVLEEAISRSDIRISAVMEEARKKRKQLKMAA